MDKETNQQVDKLLLEQGQYTPLELLLQEGRLLYDDYESWRAGKCEYLVDVLFGDPEQIKNILLNAESYVQQLGLQGQTLDYHTWHDNNPRRLSFSGEDAMERCFNTRYNKADDELQFDLFMDSPASNLSNGVINALANRNVSEARTMLEKLYDLAPDHALLGDLEQLVEAAEKIDLPVIDVEVELQKLQNRISPLAETLLNNDSRNLLIPCWRRLSNALQDVKFDSANPENHISYTAIQAFDWELVRTSVEREYQWQSSYVLLQRHAQACEQLRMPEHALASWFQLCWYFPEHSDIIDSVANHEMREYWHRFQDLEIELDILSFPAWLLLYKPGLIKLITPCYTNNIDNVPETFLTVIQLLDSGALTGQAPDNITLRTRLKALNTELFQYYLTKYT